MNIRPATAWFVFLLPFVLLRGGEPGGSRPVGAGLAEAGPGSPTPATIQPDAKPTGAAPVAPAPAINWVLPLFSDKEGHRTMTLRGTEARPDGKNIVVTNLSITTFSGDATARVDSILLSPHAVYSPKENRASGDLTVRFIQDDVEVTGTGWTYDHAAKKVSLREKVRVTFRTRLNDILK